MCSLVSTSDPDSRTIFGPKFKFAHLLGDVFIYPFIYSINIYWIVHIVPNYLLGGRASMNKTDMSPLFIEFAICWEKIQLKNDYEKMWWILWQGKWG